MLASHLLGLQGPQQTPAGTKVFEEALNAVKFLGLLKKFGLAQNILGPVKGQGINSA